MVIYGINRNFWGRFPGKIFLGELLAVQPMVDARKVVFVAYKAEVNCCLWTLGPGNTPSYYLAHFIILKKLLIWVHQVLAASHGIFTVVPRLFS